MGNPASLMSCDFSGSGFRDGQKMVMPPCLVPVRLVPAMSPNAPAQPGPAGGHRNVQQQQQQQQQQIEECSSPRLFPHQPWQQVLVYERTHDDPYKQLADVWVRGAAFMKQAEFVKIVKTSLRKQGVLSDDYTSELNVYLWGSKKKGGRQTWVYLPHEGREDRVVTDPETGSKEKKKVEYLLGERCGDKDLTLAVQLVRCGSNNQDPCVHWARNTCHADECKYCHDSPGSQRSRNLAAWHPPRPDSA